MKTNNTNLFIELYNILDDLLREKYHEQSRSFSVINRYVNQLEKTSSLENHKKARKINMIRVLRNNLVHEFDLNAEDLIDISDETINFLKDEIELLKNPKNALGISTKLSNLYFAQPNDLAKDVIKNMSNKGFTQVPVIKDRHLIGVFSPNVIFSYLAKEGLNRNRPLLIKDFMDFIPCKKHISEKYVFIQKDALIDEVVDLFDDYYRQNKKLAAIFVSEHGDENEAILGMIVPVDIIKNS